MVGEYRPRYMVTALTKPGSTTKQTEPNTNIYENLFTEQGYIYTDQGRSNCGTYFIKM